MTEKKKEFRMTQKADMKLKSTLNKVAKATRRVCELHSYDENNSISQGDFEQTIIEKVFEPVCENLSKAIRGMMGVLTEQAKKEIGKNVQH